MSHCETCLPFPILAVNEDAAYRYFYTIVLKFALIGPHVSKTGKIAYFFSCQKVACFAQVNFCTKTQAVVKEISLETYIETMIGFPLNFGVRNICKLETR